MKAHWLYLKYVVRHKWYVFWACFWYGLYWRGIKHDWTKFLPSEWFPYVNYFYGGGSTRETKGQYNIDEAPLDFEMAWNHHQKANDHHWQYWVRFGDDGTILEIPMSDACRKEMLADWCGAGKALGKPNTWEWYAANKDKMRLHPETRAWVEQEMKDWENMHRVGVMLGFEHD